MAARCEVCHRPLWLRPSAQSRRATHHDEQYVEVGHKGNGTPRVVCMRRSCERTWRDEAPMRRAGWPEVRAEAKGVALRQGRALMAEAAIKHAEPRNAAPALPVIQPVVHPAAKPTHKEDPVAEARSVAVRGKNGQGGGYARKRPHQYPVAMAQWVIAKARELGMTSTYGANILGGLVRSEHPEWLNHRDGGTVTDEAVNQFISTTLRQAGLESRRGATQLSLPTRGPARAALLISANGGDPTPLAPPVRQPAVPTVAPSAPGAVFVAVKEAENKLARVYASRISDLARKAADRGNWQDLEAVLEMLEASLVEAEHGV